MKIITICIKKKGLKTLPLVLEHCKKEHVDRLIILLYADYIIHEEGLRKVLDVISNENQFPTHLIHQGLAYDMSPREYQNIFKDYPPFCLESNLLLPFHHAAGKLSFNSTDAESFLWDDQGYLNLLESSKGPDFYIGAVDYPEGDAYWDDWGKAAWSLSRKVNTYLLYMEDNDMVLIELNHTIQVHSLFLQNGELSKGKLVKSLNIVLEKEKICTKS